MVRESVQVLRLFDAMDSNQNGAIDLDEFREVIGAFGPTRRLCSELLKVSMATDRTSYGYSTECGGWMTCTTGPRLIELKRMFQEHCKGSATELSPDNFFEALKSELGTHPSPLETAILFCAADR